MKTGNPFLAYAKKCWTGIASGWLELISLSPVLLGIAGSLYNGSAWAWGWLAGLAGYTLLGALSAGLPFLNRLGLLILWTAPLTVGWAWLLHGISYNALLSVAAGAILVTRAAGAVRSDRDEIQPIFPWLGLALCAPSGFYIHRAEGLGGYSDGLAVIASALFLLALLIGNSYSLTGGAYGGKGRTASARYMRRFNRLLVAVFGLPVFLLSFWGLVDGAIGTAVKNALRWLLGLLAGEEPAELPPEPAVTPAPQQSGLPEAKGEPALIWVILEYLLMIVFIAAALAFLYYCGRALARWLPDWLKRVTAWFSRRAAGKGDDPDPGYVDTVLSTRESKPGGAGPLGRLKRLFQGRREVRWEDLADNRQRMRYLYAQAVRRAVRAGFRWRAEWTPAEAAEAAAREAAKPTAGLQAAAAGQAAAKLLDRELCDAYERARYGGPEPGDAEVAQFRSRNADK
ncbi:DUF4129 domain-containing protein [Paenibacillus sp. YN15]|uniref:DUF4129 domain-containing protein n=1 Tax=Paenibacillus sp. YN15 TaxID=1742774 RepID=UPI0015EC5CFA|nr:DUF4129 domain-containing protein [Paenibacillus sp. YN15]